MAKAALKLAALLFGLATMPMLHAGPALADTVTIAHSTWVGYGPFYIARDKGFFKKNGVDVDLVRMDDPKERFPALMAGRVQVIAGPVDAGPLHLKRPSEVQYVAALAASDGGDGIVATKAITAIADLRGKRVAVDEGSVSEFYLSVLLAKVGLKERDLHLVDMTADDAGRAFAAHRVDAAVTWEPWLSRGKAPEFGHLLVDSSTTPGLITDAIIVTSRWGAGHKAEIAAVLKSWNEAVTFYEEHPEEAIPIMAKGLGGWLADPKVFKETLGGVTFYDEAADKAFFGTLTKPGPLYAVVQEAIAVWWRNGGIRPKVTPSDMVDDSYVNP